MTTLAWTVASIAFVAGALFGFSVRLTADQRELREYQRLIREHNAAVAAEPDLLAALKRMLGVFDVGNAAEHDEGCRCVVHEARAAIAAAEGRL